LTSAFEAGGCGKAGGALSSDGTGAPRVLQAKESAQRASIHPYADPYLWSAFILMGDPD
jgi:hypothetical protein